jgi:hypothetical protein
MEKRTLSNFKQHLKKETDDIKFPITGLFIFSKIIEYQNIKLLEKIAKKKFSDQDEKENFIDKFNKISYHIPEETNTREEGLQYELQKFVK